MSKAKIIDGRAIAKRIIAELKRKPKPKKILAAILVGRDHASISFLKQKERVAHELGIRFKLHKLSGLPSEDTLLRLIKKLNRDRSVGGIVLQLPLPKKYNRDRAIAAIAAKKDVDALRSTVFVTPPAAAVVATIVRAVHYQLRGKRAVVIGRGFLVGDPVAKWLASRRANVTVFHRNFFDKKLLRGADFVVSGMGRPAFVKGDWLKQGAFLIDFGYGMKSGKVNGDFDFKSCARKVSFITPTPGGTGPILVAELFRNFYHLTGTPHLSSTID